MTTSGELIETLAEALREIANVKQSTAVGVVAEQALAAYGEYVKAEGVERRTYWQVETYRGGVWTALDTRHDVPPTACTPWERIVRVDEIRTVAAAKASEK